MITGQIDCTFITQQRDLFGSGLVAEIGANAYAVWSAIKYFANYRTGEAFPGMREIGRKVGVSKDTVHRAIQVLMEAHLLRIVDNSKYKRKGQTYIARERIVVRLGNQILCVVVIDYVPEKIRKTITRINEALKTGEKDSEAWAEVEIIPGSGFSWDANSKTLKASVELSEIPEGNNERDGSYQRLGEEILTKIAPELAQQILHKKEASSHSQDGDTSHR